MARKLKILEICNLDRFAASPYILPFLSKLVERGHEVHLACRVTAFAPMLEQAGISVHDIPITRSVTPLRDAKAYRAIKRLIREGSYDLVHTHNPKDGILGRRAAWKIKVPAVVHTCNGFYFSHRSPTLKRWMVLRAEKYASRRCHRIIFVNSEDLALAARKGIAGPSNARLIYNGVELDRFHPGEEPSLRGELGIPPDATVLGYVGEIRKERNLEVLVKAASSLEGKHPGIHVVMVGDHSLEPGEPRRLSGLASRLGISGRLTFTGYRSDPERFYRMFDLYVLPSTREGFGVTLIEAMASRVPVIACRVRGPRDIISDGIDGILIEDRDPRELADAAAFLLETPEAVSSYTEKALDKVRKDFGHKRMRSLLLAEYKLLTRQRDA
ncbi:MAG: glycosyltransferase family 4 protein [Actinomycetota bacterium]|nr:glycosyltransferase family 4 protein [Actinomycetota bacterium]